MRARRLTDPVAFLAAAEPLLAADEPRHNLVYGLAATLRDQPAAYPNWDLWLVEDGGAPLAAALRTPPRKLILARPATAEALGALVAALWATGTALPGVSGAEPEASAFAGRWVALAGGSWRTEMAQTIYALTALRGPRLAPGRSRPATAADAPLVEALVAAFSEEALPDEPVDRASLRRSIGLRLGAPPERGGFWLWEDGGQVVSLSSHGGPTPRGIRIGPVYTPPTARRRGYASCLVAAQSAWLLARGHRFCFLYADQANPTSNAIYRRIGYEPVCAASTLAFDPA